MNRKVELTSKEWQRVIEALDREPDPESFTGFGPAYEAAKQENDVLAKKILRQLR